LSYLSGTETSVPITVSAQPSYQIYISPTSPWKIGQQITINLKGSAAVASTAYFYMNVSTAGQTVYLGSANLTAIVVNGTNIEGYQAQLTVTLSYVMQTQSGINVPVFGPVSIYATVGSIQSNTVSGTIYIPTQFGNIQVSPSTIYPGQNITVTGQLQMASSNNQWIGAPNQTISYTLTNSSTGSQITSGTVTTDSGGNFSISLTAPSSPGNYTLSLVFAGSSSAYLLPSGVNISFGSSTTTTTTTPTTKLSTTDLALILGGVGLVAGLGIYELSKKNKS